MNIHILYLKKTLITRQKRKHLTFPNIFIFKHFLLSKSSQVSFLNITWFKTVLLFKNVLPSSKVWLMLFKMHKYNVVTKGKSKSIYIMYSAIIPKPLEYVLKFDYNACNYYETNTYTIYYNIHVYAVKYMSLIIHLCFSLILKPNKVFFNLSYLAIKKTNILAPLVIMFCTL